MLTLEEWQAVRLTLQVAAVAVLGGLPFAIVLGWVLAKRDFPGKFLVETLISLPLVMPPVVTGYLLLMVFGRHGLLGSFLENWLGLRFVFDWKGAALAAAVVGFPPTPLEAVAPEYLAARTPRARYRGFRFRAGR